MSFVHLRVHTEYSISDSIIKIEQLVARTAELGMPAVGVTEHQNLFSAIKFFKACMKFGVKPIIGAEMYIEGKKDPDDTRLLVLLCQSIEGYRALCRLISGARTQNEATSGVFPIKRKWLTESSCEGLIALSGGILGEITPSKHRTFDDNLNTVKEFQALFPGRFYLEITRTGSSADNTDNLYRTEANHTELMLQLAETSNVPIVASHLPRFLKQDDFNLHEIKICIQTKGFIDDSNREVKHTNSQFFRSAEEMAEIFSDLPNAVENTVEIARRCNLMFELNKVHMPEYSKATTDVDINSHLRKLSFEGLKRRLKDLNDIAYKERLEHELKIIETTDFAGYFLIVAEIISWAKSQGIPVGPGRGSGVGSLVAYCLDITTVDPLVYGLIFERFLNPERLSPPDFDIDFCVYERDRVIDYVKEHFGEEKVAQITTYNTMAARAAVKDVGRVIRPDYLFYDKLSKLIPTELNITLEDALSRKSSELRERYQNETRVKDLIDTAQALEGAIRNVGKHPAGVVIAPTQITDYTAVYTDSENTNLGITHFDKFDIEQIGLVKFDFLGLTTLTVIQDALNAINASRKNEQPIVANEIPLDDSVTYDYICSGHTVGIFQLESRGMQRLIQMSQPSQFSDLIDLLALFRPGPLQQKMDRTYVENKKNSKYTAIHDDIREVLDTTHGVILYQEQVMKIAQIMSGYSLGEADILRDAMGKKKKKEMRTQRERFIQGAVDNGYDKKLATEVCNLIESFAEYGFNKSHSVAYALLAYQTAYLKAHYRTQFIAACISIDFNSKTTVKFFNDARLQGIKFLPPDINHSVYEFKAQNDKEILYGLGGIRHIGSTVVESIIRAREQNGPFKSLYDFCSRVDLQTVGRGVCHALICGGAFDTIYENRAELVANLEGIYGLAQQQVVDRNLGQASLFELENTQEVEFEMKKTKPWTIAEKLKQEHTMLGLYLSGHPIEQYAVELKSLGVLKKLVNIQNEANNGSILAGWVQNKQFVDSKRGGVNIYFDLEDATGRLSVVLYSQHYEQFKNRIKENAPLVVSGRFNEADNRAPNRLLEADTILDLNAIRQSNKAKIILKINGDEIKQDTINKLVTEISSHSGTKHDVMVDYKSKSGVFARYHLGKEWRVTICDELINRFREILGYEWVEVDYSEVGIRSLLDDNAGTDTQYSMSNSY